MDLSKFIRDVVDFPVQGVVFKDICPLLQNAAALNYAVEAMIDQVRKLDVDVIAAPDARGFIFGVPMAMAMQLPFVPIRKAGKLPYQTTAFSYELEYGKDTLEMHVDSIQSGDKVLLVDDLLATGGTIAACGRLVEQQGGVIAGYSFLIELEFLSGREKLDQRPIERLLSY
ncbi:MAG: adenine phosphoribosyltransferase [Pirellulales bacterium]|nr:adenine phosphoribosyltransferase [Pirellulales bacterium]|tara:strand:+ start:1186 stop:1698 length:513 start_codon:yes stop_codon:yes gene_type:complete